MKEILSKQNEKIKDLKKQKLKNRFLLFLDNPKTIKEAICSGMVCKILLIDKEKQDLFASLKADEIYLTNQTILKEFSEVKTPQGVVGVFNFEPQSLKTPTGNFLVLDSLQDAGNIGTLLRSALGADFKDVYLLDCTALSNDKIVRSSMASIFKLNVYETTKEFFAKFAKEKNLNIACADMVGQNIYNTKLTSPIGVVIGNEGQGISKTMRQISKMMLSIPLSNSLESLNAAVAGSILMFQIKNNK